MELWSAFKCDCHEVIRCPEPTDLNMVEQFNARLYHKMVEITCISQYS
jgi:hypothetical protein